MMYDYFAPIGASIGFTDSLPLLAFLFKPFSAWLPVDFQYQGMWLFLSLALQGVFGYLLAGELTGNRTVQLVAGFFFLFNPLVFFRSDNLEVRSYWLLLAAVWHDLASSRRFRLQRYAGVWLLLAALVGLVHPYLALMVAAVGAASILTGWLVSRQLCPLAAGLLLAALAGVILLEWWLTVFFTFKEVGYIQTSGLGVFSTNLNAFINPTPYVSRWIAPRPLRAGQFEGFAYPGIGVYALLACGLALAIRRGQASRRLPRFLRHLPLLLLAFAFGLYALSNWITWDEQILLTLPAPSGFILEYLHTFRASGRFIWLAYFLLIGLGVWLVARNASPRAALVILGACLAIQLADLSVQGPDMYADWVYTPRLNDPAWEKVIAPFERVVPMPPFGLSIAAWPEKWADADLSTADYKDFAHLAAAYGKGFSGGYLARLPYNEVEKQQKVIENRLRSGHPAPEYLYVFTPKTLADYLARFKRLGGALRCHVLDGYLACYSAKLPAQLPTSFDLADLSHESLPLLDFLQRYRGDVIVMVARDEASFKLGQAVRDYLAAQGAQINRLAFQDSYLLVLYNGQVIFENRHPDLAIEQRWAAGTRLADEIDPLPGELWRLYGMAQTGFGYPFRRRAGSS